MSLSSERRRALLEAAHSLDAVLRVPYALGDDVEGMARLDNEALSLLVQMQTVLQRDDEAIFAKRASIFQPRPRKVVASSRTVGPPAVLPRRGPRP